MRCHKGRRDEEEAGLERDTVDLISSEYLMRSLSAQASAHWYYQEDTQRRTHNRERYRQWKYFT